MPQVIETMTNEELEEYRAATLDLQVAECCPTDLTFEQVRAIHQRHYELTAALHETYDLDSSENISFDIVGGRIMYGVE